MKMLKPETESELAEIVAAAQGPLTVLGGGTRPIGATRDGEVLSTAAMAGIVDYEPGALTLVAKAGTSVAEIERVLAAEGQRLAFEPMDHRKLLGTDGEPTIGGVVAGNVSGPRRVAVGAARDFLLGVRFVDGMGRVLKNGGRVMKNVTGYDLVKLMAGSRGTLGVLSEVALKVLPVPETQATLVLPVQNEVDAVAAMSMALGSPYEVSGAAMAPSAGEGAKVFLRVEGFAASVAYRTGQLSALLGRFGAATVDADPASSAETWRGIRDAEAFRHHEFVARLSIKPLDLVDFYQAIANVFCSCTPKQQGFTYAADWGGGLVWVAADKTALERNAAIAPKPGTDPMLHGGQLLIEWLQSYATETGGHATMIKAPLSLRQTVPSFQPESVPVARISQALRAKFDPRGILNPGLMG
jgi:glycolate oxidase FAD binding subunit